MIFGKPAYSANRLTENIIRGLISERSPHTWTGKILQVLDELGKAKGLYVSPDMYKDQGEYLVDMMWQKKDRRRTLPDIVLAIESESSRYKKDPDDFEKLMHVKAPQKLFIFRSREHAKDGLEFIESVQSKYMKSFTQHVRDEEYVVLEFAKRESMAFKYEYKVGKSGKIGRVKFREISSPTPFPSDF